MKEGNKTMKHIIFVLFIILAAFIKPYIDIEWIYIYGFTIGTISQAILICL